MYRRPASKRGLTPGHPRPCVPAVCRTELRNIHALAALLRFWVVKARLPQDDASLCTLHRVRLAWEVRLRKFKLRVVVQFGSHKRPQQRRGELKSRLEMVGYDRDRTSTSPKEMFVVLIPIRRLVRVGRFIIWGQLPKRSVNCSSCRHLDWQRKAKQNKK